MPIVNGDGSMTVLPVTQTDCLCVRWVPIDAGAP